MTVNVSKDQANLLFGLFKQSETDDAFTVNNCGVPVFDTVMGTVQFVEFRERQRDDGEAWGPLSHLKQEEMQIVADLKLIPKDLAARLGVKLSSPPRYVRIPCVSMSMECEWKREESEAFDECERGQKWVMMEIIKEERVPNMVISWLEKLGRERKIRYLFDITALAP